VRPPAHATLDNAADFAWQHDDVFGRIATRYDLLCDVFSLGIHRLWKRRVAQLIASEHWTTLLDGATGTGGIITRLLAHQAVLGRTVVASDISRKMLAVAQRKLAPLGDKVQLRQLDAEGMPTVADSKGPRTYVETRSRHSGNLLGALGCKIERKPKEISLPIRRQRAPPISRYSS
jgi:ubiquinone/menaquinone biosynthesis C-methylase UbiE